MESEIALCMPAHNSTLIVAGGGTGGHVLAGIAIADAWKSGSSKANAIFVGARGGIEEKLVPRAGYPLSLLALGSLKRVSAARRIRTLFQLPLALIKSSLILFRIRPKAVIGVGGYASGPLVLMARLLGWMWGTRVAILEQNAVPGFTNRVLSRFAHVVFSAFPGIESRFPGKQVAVTGNPVRSAMKPLPAAARDPFQIFVFGGSQGAMGVNTLVIEALPHLRDLKSTLRFVHQTGEADYERVKRAHEEAASGARVEKFIYEMPDVYSASSLLVCRAGSSTLAEIAAVGRASILIPLPTAADDHQAKNAAIMVREGAALMVDQRKSSGKELAEIIRALHADMARLSEMESAARKLYRPQAAHDVVRGLLGG